MTNQTFPFTPALPFPPPFTAPPVRRPGLHGAVAISAASGAAVGTVVPVIGTIIGLVMGAFYGVIIAAVLRPIAMMLCRKTDPRRAVALSAGLGGLAAIVALQLFLPGLSLLQMLSYGPNPISVVMGLFYVITFGFTGAYAGADLAIRRVAPTMKLRERGGVFGFITSVWFVAAVIIVMAIGSAATSLVPMALAGQL